MYTYAGLTAIFSDEPELASFPRDFNSIHFRVGSRSCGFLLDIHKKPQKLNLTKPN